MGLGVLGDPGNSVILDDISPHFDGNTENRLQKLINQESNLNPIQLERAKNLIDKITSLKISKYNHAPIEKINIGNPGKPKILLIDQRFGDFSVSYGLGDEKTFERMLFVAVTKYPDYEIVVKLHPDATSGIKSSYFSKNILDKFSSYKNIITIGFDINPYSLFEEVEKVFVCSSGVGFEALMAKKEVHCFGMPFYANRGLTTDYQEVSYRTKKVSLETLFYYAYLYLSKYVNPDNGQRCSLEELVDIFADKINIKK
jgi:capsule polysaccharide export protein KpsC/LpsZ